MLRKRQSRHIKILCLFFYLACQIFDASSLSSETISEKNLNELAYTQLKSGKYSQSFKTSKLALKRAKKENNKIEMARAYSNIASNFRYLGESSKALSIYLKSLDLASKTKNIDGELRAINNIASIYSVLKDTNEAINYRKKQLKIAINHKNPEDILISYIGLISAQMDLGNLDKAHGYASISKRLLEDNENHFYEVYYQFAFAGLLEKEEKLEEALEALKLALSISKQRGYDGLIVSSMISMAELNFKLGKFKKVIKSTNKVLKIAEKLRSKEKTSQAHQLLASTYELTQQYKLALEHTKQTDSIKLNQISEKVKILAEITRIDRQVDETESNLKRSIKDQKILSLQIEQQTKNQIIWLIAIVSIVIIIFSLFNRRNNKKEIYRQRNVNKKLKELDKIKDRILKNTSHELRTPLNGIVGLSEVILTDPENYTPKTTLDMVRLIKSSGEQLTLIINDILEMSKSRSRTITIVNHEFNLSDLMSDVIKVCEPIALEKNIEIIFLQSDVTDRIILDKTRLQQILFNIIGNAVKFTDKGYVNINFIRNEKELVIEIEDTGIGIPNDKIERVFEGFEQVDSSDTRTASGSGLGLAISRNICIALGGELNIESELGFGTKVTITLPISTKRKNIENA